jgi:phage-related protein
MYTLVVEGRPLVWVGTALEDVRAFPPQARRAAGYQLRRVQEGLTPSDWKPMTSIGSGVVEIRLRGHLEHRIFYVAKFAEAIYVLHAFQKKSQRTRQADLGLARARLREVHAHRGHRKDE